MIEFIQRSGLVEYGFDKTFLTDEDLEQSMDDSLKRLAKSSKTKNGIPLCLISKNLSKFSSLILF